MKNHSSSSSNHAKSACLACSNKWYHSLRDSNSVKTWLVHVLSSSDLHFEELLTHNNIPLTLLWQSTPIENPQHVWCYESLEARQAAREVVWQATQEQWQEIVARTVPLIRWLFVDILTKNKTISTIWFYRRMSSRVLVPLPISTTKWTRAKMRDSWQFTTLQITK